MEGIFEVLIFYAYTKWRIISLNEEGFILWWNLLFENRLPARVGKACYLERSLSVSELH